ncbi:helix-turn-helix domain-containing protein [Microbacterium album]|uniref:HTH araC/xylS-type domain-containing protein n=1 Tax=Microbacterium album TaxID=2053191 RepID=A0A917IE01_9MICO|nr:helix-turn-helix domain-containing protein [Microbacterium album]GGH36143.1 hypothetical protein GCM10010921_05120 [Microbacterium album]
MSDTSAASRGVLYPARLPTFHREPVTAELAVFVRWFWVPEWNIDPGRTSRQHVIGFPACNLVVENAMTGLSGPTSRASYRDLTGKGWAVGALLRPAAVPAIVGDPAALRDAYRQVDQPELATSVRAVMNADTSFEERRVAAIAAFTEWLSDRLVAPSEEGLLANRMVEVAETDPSVLSVGDLAARLDVSTRTLQRLAAKYVGLPPLALIRRRRLQEAAERLRHKPDLDLTALAHELGYVDHAHLSNNFRAVLGFNPSAYRHSVSAT